MNKTIKIVLLLIAAFVLSVFGFYYFKGNRNANDEQMPLETSSIKGCYVAKLAKDVYTLVIESQNGEDVAGKLAYNNYQKDSSSGSFVGIFSGGLLNGSYSFDSEGIRSDRQVIFKKDGDSFIQGFGQANVVDGKETFAGSGIVYDPKSTFVKLESCVNIFTENNNTFSFSHNPYFFAYEMEEQVPTVGWSSDSNQRGVILANVIIPRTFMPDTNFSDMRLTIGRSAEPKAIKSCTVDPVNAINKGEVALDGYLFTKFESVGVATDNLYETTSYKGIVDGDCYAIEYTIHSSNIGNYSLDQGVKEFDQTKIIDEAEKIVKSLKFIINSD